MPKTPASSGQQATRLQMRSQGKCQRGILVIEIGVAVVILCLAAAILYWTVGGSATQSVSWGLNGVVETRCVNGFQFIVGQSGSAQQVLDERGGGVRCTEGKGSRTVQPAAKPVPIPTD